MQSCCFSYNVYIAFHRADDEPAESRQRSVTRCLCPLNHKAVAQYVGKQKYEAFDNQWEKTHGCGDKQHVQETDRSSKIGSREITSCLT